MSYCHIISDCSMHFHVQRGNEERYTTSKWGYKLFNSEIFGVASKYLGNSYATGKAGIFNNKNFPVKFGWSNVGANGGGMILRFGTKNQSFHLDIPSTFVSNNPSMIIIEMVRRFGGM